MEYMEVLKEYCCAKHAKIYIVGGTIRDKLLERKISDIDFAVDGNFEDAALSFKEKLGGNFVKLHEDTIRVVASDVIYDFSPIKGSDIYEDIKKRDFTINAMAQDIESGEIIDVLNSKDDLKNGIIRVSYEDAFKDDPLRMLRAFRFASKYNFKIEDKTFKLIKSFHKFIHVSAGERISAEIFKIFENENTAEYVRFMDDAGIIEEIFPYMSDMKCIGKCKYHVVDAYTHSILSIEHFDILIKKMYHNKYSEKIKKIMEETMGCTKHKAVLKLATFLHDIGKPEAMKNKDGKVTFKMHEVYGAKKFVNSSKWLMFSKSQNMLIKSVIAGHMRPLWLFNQKSSNKAIYKMFCELNEYTIDVLLSSLFDVTATRSLLDENKEEAELYFNYISRLIEKYYGFQLRKNLINGNDVKRITGFDGKKIGEVLKKVNEEIFCENINSRDEAIEYIKDLKGRG